MFSDSPLCPHVQNVVSRTTWGADGGIARIPKSSPSISDADILEQSSILYLLDESEGVKVFRWNVDAEVRYANICSPPEIVRTSSSSA